MITVVVGGHSFDADVDLLKKNSTYFAKALRKWPSQRAQHQHEISLDIPGVEPHMFGVLLLFMRFGYLDMDANDITAIQKTANLLGVNKATKALKRIRPDETRWERLLLWYRSTLKPVAAPSDDDEERRHYATRMVAARFDQCVATPLFQHLNAKELIPVLSHDVLGTSCEMNVFVACLRWLSADEPRRLQSLLSLLKCVRFSLMSKLELIQCLYPPLLKNLTNYPPCAYLILSAFGYVTLRNEGLGHLLARYQSKQRIYLVTNKHPHQGRWPLPPISTDTLSQVQLEQKPQYSQAIASIQQACRRYLEMSSSKQRNASFTASISLPLMEDSQAFISESEMSESENVSPSHVYESIADAQSTIYDINVEHERLFSLDETYSENFCGASIYSTFANEGSGKHSLSEHCSLKNKPSNYSGTTKPYKYIEKQDRLVNNEKNDNDSATYTDWDELSKSIENIDSDVPTELKTPKSDGIEIAGTSLRLTSPNPQQSPLASQPQSGDVMKDRGDTVLCEDIAFFLGGRSPDDKPSDVITALDEHYNVRFVGQLPMPLYGHAVVQYQDFVYVCGGFTLSESDSYIVTAVNRCFKAPIDDLTTWKRIADMKVAKGFHAMTATSDGKIYSLGGCLNNRVASDVMEWYDIRLNRWTRAKTSLPRRCYGAAATSVMAADAILLLGGVDSDGKCSNSVDSYNLAQKQWSAVGDFSLPRPLSFFGFLATSCDSFVVIGGHDGQNALEIAYKYQNGKWIALTSLPESSCGGSVIRYNESIIYIAEHYARKNEPQSTIWQLLLNNNNNDNNESWKNIGLLQQRQTFCGCVTITKRRGEDMLRI